MCAVLPTPHRPILRRAKGVDGVESSDPQVVIGTSCGKLILKRGVLRDNMHEIAEAVKVDRS